MKLKISVEAEVILVNLLMLLPAAGFWASAVLRMAFGTDYFFDVVFEQLSKTFLGNVVLTTLVIFLPGLGVGINAIVYRRKKEGLAKWMLAVCAVFLVAGFLTVEVTSVAGKTTNDNY